MTEIIKNNKIKECIISDACVKHVLQSVANTCSDNVKNEVARILVQQTRMLIHMAITEYNRKGILLTSEDVIEFIDSFKAEFDKVDKVFA